MWSGSIAMMGFFSVGRGGNWASHEIEHQLSALYDVPHGAGLAVVQPAWIEHVWRREPKRFVQFAQRVWDVDPSLFPSEEAVVLEGVRRMRAFFREIGLPTTLRELGAEQSRIGEMAKRCCGSGTVGGHLPVNAGDVEEIYRRAW